LLVHKGIKKFNQLLLIFVKLILLIMYLRKCQVYFIHDIKGNVEKCKKNKDVHNIHQLW